MPVLPPIAAGTPPPNRAGRDKPARYRLIGDEKIGAPRGIYQIPADAAIAIAASPPTGPVSPGAAGRSIIQKSRVFT
jgi:hypothetical protein